MSKYKFWDPNLFRKIFGFSEETHHPPPKKIPTENFVEFHQEAFKAILLDVGLKIDIIENSSLVSAGENAFRDIGHKVQSSNKYFRGHYVSSYSDEINGDESSISIFDVISHISYNILRQKPIKKISRNSNFVNGLLHNMVEKNPNEHAVLSLYSNIAIFHRDALGKIDEKWDYIYKLEELCLHPDRYYQNFDSKEAMSKLLMS